MPKDDRRNILQSFWIKTIVSIHRSNWSWKLHYTSVQIQFNILFHFVRSIATVCGKHNGITNRVCQSNGARKPTAKM